MIFATLLQDVQPQRVSVEKAIWKIHFLVKNFRTLPLARLSEASNSQSGLVIALLSLLHGRRIKMMLIIVKTICNVRHLKFSSFALTQASILRSETMVASPTIYDYSAWRIS